MDRMNEHVQEVKYKPKNIKLSFYSIFLTALFILELYLMINNSLDYILIGIVGLIIIVFVYLLVNEIYQIYVRKEIRREEQYANIFKSEKAAYMLMRNNFSELEEKTDNIIRNAKTPTEELIQAQKAIAKVTINRNKENANAMMNSNDRLMDRVQSFEDKLSELSNEIGEQQKSVTDFSNQQILAKQNEVISGLREMELSLKNEILKAINEINSQAQVRQANSEPVFYTGATRKETYANDNIEVKRTSTSEDIYTESELELEEIDLEMNSGEDMVSELDLELEPELEEAEPESGLEDSVSDELSLPDEPLMEDITAEDVMIEEPLIEESIAEEVVIEEPIKEEPIKEEPIKEEPIIEEPVLEEPIIEEPVVEEPVLEEPVVEEPPIQKPPMPDLSDPNKVMTPDEISALFSNTADVGVSLEEAVAEVPVQEEKPPMPDLSNPNKVMTPEEIAALLANM